MSRWQQGTSRSEAAGSGAEDGRGLVNGEGCAASGVGNHSVGTGTAVGLFVVRPRAVEVVHIHGDTADLLVDGQPIAVALPGGEATEGFAEDTAELIPLCVDANFYGSLPDVQTRIEYLSGREQRGKVYGRVLWHDLPGENAVISVAVRGGFSLYPVRTEWAPAGK